MGQKVLRKEDSALIQGRGQFVDDLEFNDSLHVGFSRSPYAHANILSIKFDRVLNRKGVIAVLTYDQIKDRMTEPLLPRESKWIRPHRLQCLAKNKVRYVGEPVVAVLAEDIYTAEDAIEDIEIKYQPISPVMESKQALDPKFESINNDWRTNIAGVLRYASGEVEEYLNKADLLIEREFAIQRHSASPIETRGCIAEFQPATSTLTVWSNTHLPQTLRTALSTCLHIEDNNIRIISPNIGGSFGSKSSPYPEDILIPLLSIIYGKKIKWIETRSENFASASHGREQTHNIKVAFRKDGKILAIRDKIAVDLGAYPTGSGPNEALISASYITGCYDVRNYEFEILATLSNKSPLGPYRGFGKSAPNFVIERIMDIAAKKLDLDPRDIRLVNFVRSFPYKNPVGALYDSGDYSSTLQRASKFLRYEELRTKQKEMHSFGEYIGIGFSCSIDPTGGTVYGSIHSPLDGVTIRITRGGKVNVYTGACGLIGTGHETTLAQVIGDNLGVKIEDVKVTEGDTNVCPTGLGSFSDRCGVYTTSAAVLVCRELRKRIVQIAALMLDTSPDDLDINQSIICPKEGKGRNVALSDVAKMAYFTPYLLPDDIETGLESTKYFTIRNPKFWPTGIEIDYFPCHGNCTHAAVVKLDKESGKIEVLNYVVVHNSGRVINPLIVDGQFHGGVLAGLGGSVFECVDYDSEGQLLTSSFMDYLIPSASEAPSSILVDHIEVLTKNTILGTMGCGESGAIGAYGAIANAINDAISYFGQEIDKLPLSPQLIWGSLRSA